MSGDERRSAPHVARNASFIIEKLEDLLPSSGLVLEVASGTGEHAARFAGHFPGLRFQPSDPDPRALRSIAAWRAELGLANLLQPVPLDVTAEWPIGAADAILCINMIHISPWEATIALMRGAGRILPAGGLLYLYGPFFEDGVPAAPSNHAFDTDLKRRDPRWGVRRLEAVIEAANEAGLVHDRTMPMPANNLSVALRRQG